MYYVCERGFSAYDTISQNNSYNKSLSTTFSQRKTPSRQLHAVRPVARIVKTRRHTGRAPFPSPPLLSPTLPLLFPPSFPLPSSLEVGPLNTGRGFGERCKLPQRGLGRSPSRNRFWCILALKFGIWWQQF